MNIYFVSRSVHSVARPSELNGIVVIAANDEDARNIAANHPGTERPDTWIMSYAQVERLGVADNPHYPNRVVCRDVKAS